MFIATIKHLQNIANQSLHEDSDRVKNRVTSTCPSVRWHIKLIDMLACWKVAVPVQGIKKWKHGFSMIRQWILQEAFLLHWRQTGKAEGYMLREKYCSPKYLTLIIVYNFQFLSIGFLCVCGHLKIKLGTVKRKSITVPPKTSHSVPRLTGLSSQFFWSGIWTSKKQKACSSQEPLYFGNRRQMSKDGNTGLRIKLPRGTFKTQARLWQQWTSS